MILEIIDERLELLKTAIEELRAELHSAIAGDEGRLDGAKTYEISANLDRLVAQFLRVKERLEEEGACREASAVRRQTGEGSAFGR